MEVSRRDEWVDVEGGGDNYFKSLFMSLQYIYVKWTLAWHRFNKLHPISNDPNKNMNTIEITKECSIHLDIIQT